MKIQSVIVCIVLLSFGAVGQQDIQSSQTLSNPYLFNPAAGGMMNIGEITIGNRAQWMGVEGRPSTLFASVQSQIRGNRSKHVLDEMSTAGKTFYSTPQRTIGKKHIIGAKLLNDQVGPFTKTSVHGSYAIHLPFTSKINVGLGIGMGWSNFGIDESKVSLATAGDNAYLNYISVTSTQNFLDVSTGLIAYNDRFYFGISGSQFLKNKARFDGVQTESNYERHLYLIGAYRLDVTEKIGLEPTVILKRTNSAPINYEAGVRLHYQRLAWLSLSYRNQSAACVGIGFNALKHFRVSYSYDLGIANTQTFGNGAHEVQLGFIFGHRRNMDKEFKKDEKQSVDESETPAKTSEK